MGWYIIYGNTNGNMYDILYYYIKFMERRKARKESIEVNEKPHRQITSV
jgi:hypothetical protein